MPLAIFFLFFNAHDQTLDKSLSEREPKQAASGGGEPGDEARATDRNRFGSARN
jgi:hypothetical protein